MSSQDDNPQAETPIPPDHPGAFIADPAPLGLAGFGATTMALSLVNAGVLGDKVEGSAVVALAFFYGGLAQFLAGMWEFRKGNTFGSTAFGTYGAFWIAFASYVTFWVPDADKFPTAAANATGWFLVVFTIVTFYLLIASLRTTGILFLIFLVLTVTFVLLDLGELAGWAAGGTLGGWFGVVDAILAFYASAAAVVNFTFKKTVFPVVPLSKS
jgi:succinate-acetate transporter protein